MSGVAIDLSGKTAIITGGAGGMGEAIAGLLLQAGANVVLADIDVPRAMHLQENLRDRRVNGNEIMALEVDVTSTSSLSAATSFVLKKFGQIDILVAAAGVNYHKDSLQASAEEWAQVMDTNLKGAFLSCQAVAPAMIKSGGGKITFISSVAGAVSEAKILPYAVSKSGVIGLTRNLAVEWARYGINVNSVGPGYTLTRMTAATLADERVYQGIVKHIPFRRLCTTEDVAKAVLFLSSPMADYITGQTVFVDGGRTLI